MNTVISQALATGLPVVATRHSGFPEQVIDEKNGYLGEEANPESIADAIAKYIDQPDRWGDMSDAARAHALAHYDQTALIEKQISCYVGLTQADEVRGAGMRSSGGVGNHTVTDGAGPRNNEIRRLRSSYDKKFSTGIRVAFVIGAFPAVSETFIINQVADLLDRNIDVTVYSFHKGSAENISDRYYAHKMEGRVRVLEMPRNIFVRLICAVPKIARVFVTAPGALFRIFNVAEYGGEAYSLKNLYWAEPFLGLDADIIHCHFGTIANKYLRIKDMLGLTQPIVTTFYGYDVSRAIKEKGPHYYDRLIKESAFFFTMSNNMKERILPLGFPSAKVESLPVSIDVPSYPFAKRAWPDDGVVHLMSVGRFVEKKGFDDLLRALAILKKKTDKEFLCHIVGGPKPEEEKLRALAKELGVEDVIDWKGYMKVEDIIKFFLEVHLYVQTSKTAADGDME